MKESNHSGIVNGSYDDISRAQMYLGTIYVLNWKRMNDNREVFRMVMGGKIRSRKLCLVKHFIYSFCITFFWHFFFAIGVAEQWNRVYLDLPHSMLDLKGMKNNGITESRYSVSEL